MEVETILDDFENVCRDSFRQVRENTYCYIYRKPVLERTIQLCEENNVNYKLNQCEDYYTLMGYDNKKVVKRRK